MNQFWIIHDDHHVPQVVALIGQLEREGQTSVTSSRVHGDLFCAYQISTLLDRVALSARFESADPPLYVRFTSRDGVDEFGQGFAKGFNVAFKAAPLPVATLL